MLRPAHSKVFLKFLSVSVDLTLTSTHRHFVMEPTRSTTDALTANIRSINVLPPAHRSEPQNGELVDNPQDGYARLQDWAFVQGFALVKESSRPERWVLHYIHHHNQTKDCCKTEQKE